MIRPHQFNTVLTSRKLAQQYLVGITQRLKRSNYYTYE